MFEFETVEQLLKERNARLIVNHVDGKSFHGRVLRPEMDINAFGQALHLHITAIEQGLGIVVSERKSKKLLVESRLDITDGVDKFSVNINNLELIIEFDAATQNP